MAQFSYVKAAALGTSLSLSALGLSRTAEAGQSPSAPPPAPVAAKTEPSPLDTSAHVDRLTGALKECLPPAYDGPVKWISPRTFELAVLYGVLGGSAGLGAYSMMGGRLRGSTLEAATTSAVVGGVIAFAGTYALQPRCIEFDTRVDAVVSAEAAHNETHTVQIGKVRSPQTFGPYYGQIVSIPETNMLLASNAMKAPLVPGEKIHASVYVDGAGRIIGWSATPGPR